MNTTQSRIAVVEGGVTILRFQERANRNWQMEEINALTEEGLTVFLNGPTELVIKGMVALDPAQKRAIADIVQIKSADFNMNYPGANKMPEYLELFEK